MDRWRIGNKGLLRIPQSSSITGALPSDFSVSYPGHSLGGESYLSVEMQWMYSAAPAKRVKKIMLYEYELGHNTAELTKNICCVKDEGTVDHGTITRWFKKFYSGYKYQTRSCKPKSMDSKAMYQLLGENLVSNTWRVSGDLGISLSSVHKIGKIILSS